MTYPGIYVGEMVTRLIQAGCKVRLETEGSGRMRLEASNSDGSLGAGISFHLETVGSRILRETFRNLTNAAEKSEKCSEVSVNE